MFVFEMRMFCVLLPGTCESLIEVDASNCVAALEVAFVVNAARLLAEALRVTCLCLAEPSVEAAAASLGQRHRELGEMVVQRLLETNAARTRVRQTR